MKLLIMENHPSQNWKQNFLYLCCEILEKSLEPLMLDKKLFYS
jgi:hypothetical protein